MRERAAALFAARQTASDANPVRVRGAWSHEQPTTTGWSRHGTYSHAIPAMQGGAGGAERRAGVRGEVIDPKHPALCGRLKALRQATW